MLNWQIKHYNELSLNEFHDLLALRIKVFVVEQNCPYQELDGKDKKSFHLICKNDKAEIVGTLRILPPGVAYNDIGIGRVVIDQSTRGMNAGHQMMKEALAFCISEFGHATIYLSAQKHLESFYNKHNFNSTGKEYLEDGIPHVEMNLKWNS